MRAPTSLAGPISPNAALALREAAIELLADRITELQRGINGEAHQDVPVVVPEVVEGRWLGVEARSGAVDVRDFLDPLDGVGLVITRPDPDRAVCTAREGDRAHVL